MTLDQDQVLVQDQNQDPVQDQDLARAQVLVLVLVLVRAQDPNLAQATAQAPMLPIPARQPLPQRLPSPVLMLAPMPAQQRPQDPASRACYHIVMLEPFMSQDHRLRRQQRHVLLETN